MKKYSIGVDYGTLSARAALIDLSNGAEVCVCEYAYPHAILCGRDISNDTSAESLAMQLQHPADYLEALEHTVKKVVSDSGISPKDVVGIGFDFTACTMLPITGDGTPLCFLEKYKNEPNAYVKLWKHHGAQAEADEITALAKKEGEEWLDIYGGKVSSEWLFPKIYETLHKAPEVFDDTYRFIEAGDWIVLMLTGEESHSSCMAGYKGLWNKENGYPKNSFWAKLDMRLSDIVGTKVSENVLPTGTKAGVLCRRGAELTGLLENTAVAVPIIDAHAALPAAGITTAGKLMVIIGTSSCHIVMSENAGNVPDICGSVKDGVIAGLCAHEAVFVALEGADRKVIALLLVDWLQDIGNYCRNISSCGSFACIFSILPGSRNCYLYNLGSTRIHSSNVSCHYVIALGKVGLSGSGLNHFQCFLGRNYLHESKEGSLKNGIGVAAEA